MATVLVVDDNRNIREFCRAELEADGYRVLLAADGHEAIELVAIRAPDVVVLDVCMPSMDGLEAMACIHAKHAHMPVVFYTAEDKDFSDHTASGHVACVCKSQDVTELKEAIVRATGRRTERRGMEQQERTAH